MSEKRTRSIAGTCLPVAAWPALDRELWRQALEKADLLDEPRPAANWVPITQEAVAKSYGRWLHWLAVKGQLDPLIPPAQRVSFDRIQAYIAELQARNAPNTVHMRVLHLGRMLEVMAPGSQPDWFGRVLRQLRAARQPARDDRARQVPIGELLALGFDLLARAEQQSRAKPHLNALLHRDGLLLLILCACPLRPRSIAALRLGSHLEKRGSEWWVVLPRADTKAHRPLALPLPVALSQPIEQHLARWRPLLLSRQTVYRAAAAVDSGRLWLSKSGHGLKAKQLLEIVTRITRRELGRAVNPHLFRKIAATELAIRDPAHLGVAQRLLDHADRATTEEYYDLARSIDAARRVHQTLGALRQVAVKGMAKSTRTPMADASKENAR